MLWEHGVFRRGDDLHEMWEAMFVREPIRLLYISGKGFDARGQATVGALVETIQRVGTKVERAELLLVEFAGYVVSDELRAEAATNAAAIDSAFRPLGSTSVIPIGPTADDDISGTNALRLGADAVVSRLAGFNFVILDVSSLPRVAYLALMLGILRRLIPDASVADARLGGGVTFQVIVAEDSQLDSLIQTQDPSDDLVFIPGYSAAVQAESVQDWPMVWFPMLGEGRVDQFLKVLQSIPVAAEICPILPHPSRDPRRADRLLVEYRKALFDRRETPTANVMFVHESHPFEAYRQLLRAMRRYQHSLDILGGCRLVVTPLASKLITVGAGLACFEMRPATMERFGVAIPCAGPTRYVVSVEALRASRPDICSVVLTGEPYDPGVDN